MDDKGVAVPAAPQGVASKPQIVPLTVADIRACLVQGAHDFAAAPRFGLVLGGLFAAIGMIITLSLTSWHMSLMIYPFAIGFPLIGPFAAAGLYEVSRRLERGEPLSWGAVLSVMWAQRLRELSWMAFTMLFFFWVWMYQVRLMIALFLGRLSFSTLDKFFSIVLTTPEGWLFLGVGHVVGAALALLLFSITVISMPLLMEREIDFITAMITSVSVVLASPVAMLGWGVVVTLAILAACVPFFLGVIIILPILGHTTWHLYRKAVRFPN
jgi:uncharacterized membrane protein